VGVHDRARTVLVQALYSQLLEAAVADDVGVVSARGDQQDPVVPYLVRDGRQDLNGGPIQPGHVLGDNHDRRLPRPVPQQAQCGQRYCHRIVDSPVGVPEGTEQRGALRTGQLVCVPQHRPEQLMQPRIGQMRL
jgi:hypothetical protein